MTYTLRSDGESTGPEGKYLVWITVYRASCPRIQVRDSLEGALRAASAWRDAEEGAFDFIEGPAGIVPKQEIEDWFLARELAAETVSPGRRNALVYNVAVRDPEARSAFGELDQYFEDQVTAISTAEALALPADRVKIYARRAELSPSGTCYHLGPEQVIKDWDDPL